MTTSRGDTTHPPQLEGWAELLRGSLLPRFALICLGIWLNAADALVSATIMPSVGAELGGYAYFSWATAGFLVGAILAAASSGRLAEVIGLRVATMIAGCVFAVGCVTSATTPNMALFLVGRLIQGIGSGWISGFAMVTIGLLFPPRHLARVFTAVTSVWGVATVLSPFVGGVFAQHGNWREVFWLFALQAVAFIFAAAWLLKTAPLAKRGLGIPWGQLGILALAVGAIALGDIAHGVLPSILLVGAGFVLLAGLVRLDARARTRLLPHGTSDLRSTCGAGYLTFFCMTASSMSLLVYGPVLLQQLRNLTPLEAGYAVGAESLLWVLSALCVANASGPEAERNWIRTGACCVPASLVILAIATRAAPLGWFIAGAALMGVGFGLFTSLMSRRIMGALCDADRAIGSAAIMSVRQTGGSVGAAIAGVVANIVGLSSALTHATASAAAVWVFASAIPLGLLGMWAAFRLTGGAAQAAAARVDVSPPHL